jgi:drug/metabolite transporter (DMT)-like permease
MGYSYASFSPGLVTPVVFFATIIVQIAMTVLILGIKPSPMLLPAACVVIAGCVWVNLLLQK